eukprot:8315458-Pyramimonas_sp.AAC.1
MDLKVEFAKWLGCHGVISGADGASAMVHGAARWASSQRPADRQCTHDRSCPKVFGTLEGAFEVMFSTGFFNNDSPGAPVQKIGSF